MRALDHETLAYNDMLRENGHLVAAQALHSIHSATTIRVPGGKSSLADGAIAETNGQARGFILIDARDLDKAIQLAYKTPSTRLGGVDVRPIKELAASLKREQNN